MKEKFLKKKALTYGWERVKERPVFFVILMVIVTMLQYIPTYMDEQMGASPWIVSISSLLINTLVGMGMIILVVVVVTTNCTVVMEMILLIIQ